MVIVFSRESCSRTARRYLELSRLYSCLGNRSKAAGYLNSMAYWVSRMRESIERGEG